MRRGTIGVLAAIATVGGMSGAPAATVPATGTATQVLAVSRSSTTLDFKGSVFCATQTGTYRGTSLGAALRDSQGTWISRGMLFAEGSSETSASVNGQMIAGTRTVRTLGSSGYGFTFTVGWAPWETVNLKPPYTLHFAVGNFGFRLDQCTMSINGQTRTISRAGKAGYVDLGAPSQNLATINRGLDEAVRVEAWVPNGLRTIKLSGKRMFGSAPGVPLSRVVAWKPSAAGPEAPFAVLDGWSFGADAATRIDLANSGAWPTGQGSVPPVFVWFDLNS